MEERRVVFVAGATQGIGQDLAGFLSDRYAVVPIARSLGHDLSRTGAAASLLAAHGAPWGWVHCPGDFLEKPLLAVTDAEWEQLLSSNLWSFVRAARDLVPAMAAAGGGRVVACGVAGLSTGTAKSLGAAYYAVKSALLSVVRSLAREWAPRQVTVNLVSPGLIAHGDSHGATRRLAPRVPLGRAGVPADLRGVVDLLLGEGGGYLTGQEIVVDGGLELG